MSHSSPKVLIADDDADVRAWLRWVLTPMGITVAEAVDGVDLLTSIADVGADAVITDDRMPMPRGHQVVGMARACGVEVPFLVISSHAPPESTREHLGATEFLRKPLTPAAVRSWCQKILDLPERSARP